MDFMNLLKGIEELLYECLSWVIFYPLTLSRAAFRPLSMMRYAERELTENVPAQFDDTISPPIFLVVTLLLSHLLQLGLGVSSTAGMPAAFDDTGNLLMFRAIALGLFPLLLALQSVLLRKVKLTRQSLRPAFYGQCFTAAPLILASALVLIFAQHGETGAWVATAIGALALGWYVTVQTIWFRQGGTGWLKAGSTAFLTVLVTFVLVTGFSALTTMTAAKM